MIFGVDTSHHQPLGNFSQMKASGRCDFLFAKATEGIGFADVQLSASRAGAKNAGMLFGSYHFARPGNPVDQANYYLSVARPVAGEITVLDIEDTSIPDAGNWAAAFCARVIAVTGTPPLLYTYPNFLATHDFRPVLALGCGLWFADYADPLNSTAPWPTYVIRQFTDRGTVPGQPGTLDCNSSPLTLDQLRAYAIGATPPQEDDMFDDAAKAELDAIAKTVAGMQTVLQNPKTGIFDRVVAAQSSIAALQSTLATVVTAVQALAAGQPADTGALKAAADESAQALAKLAQAASSGS